MDPGGILSWIVIDALAGWIAGFITRSRRRGCITNIIIGILGAFLGGLALEYLDLGVASGFFESLVVATLGAIVLLALAGLARQ